MRNILLLLAFTLPLVAQEAKDTVETKGEKVVSKLQDWYFIKYDAAHARAHAKMDKNPQRYKREQMSRRNKTKQWIWTAVVGGAAYYIGYKVGQDEIKKGHKGKRPTWMPDRDKK